MKLDDVLHLLESETLDDHKARRKAVYFDLYEPDESLYRRNRKSKHDFDHETDVINRRDKQRQARYDRSKRL